MVAVRVARLFSNTMSRECYMHVPCDTWKVFVNVTALHSGSSASPISLDTQIRRFKSRRRQRIFPSSPQFQVTIMISLLTRMLFFTRCVYWLQHLLYVCWGGYYILIVNWHRMQRTTTNKLSSARFELACSGTLNRRFGHLFYSIAECVERPWCDARCP